MFCHLLMQNPSILVCTKMQCLNSSTNYLNKIRYLWGNFVIIIGDNIKTSFLEPNISENWNWLQVKKDFICFLLTVNSTFLSLTLFISHTLNLMFEN